MPNPSGQTAVWIRRTRWIQILCPKSATSPLSPVRGERKPTAPVLAPRHEMKMEGVGLAWAAGLVQAAAHRLSARAAETPEVRETGGARASGPSAHGPEGPARGTRPAPALRARVSQSRPAALPSCEGVLRVPLATDPGPEQLIRLARTGDGPALGQLL